MGVSPQPIEVLGIGTVELALRFDPSGEPAATYNERTPKHRLDNVLHIPHMSCNIVSVQRVQDIMGPVSTIWGSPNSGYPYGHVVLLDQPEDGYPIFCFSGRLFHDPGSGLIALGGPPQGRQAGPLGAAEWGTAGSGPGRLALGFLARPRAAEVGGIPSVPRAAGAARAASTLISG